MLRRSEVLDGFGGRVFIGRIWGEGCEVYDLPLVGWWGGNRGPRGLSRQPSGSSRSGVHMLLLSLLTGEGGGLVPVEALRVPSDCSPRPPGGPESGPALLFDFLSFVSCVPSLPQCNCSPFWSSGGRSPFPSNKKPGTRKGSYTQESPPQHPVSFKTPGALFTGLM